MLQPLQPLSLSLPTGNEPLVRPLPAEEQLALLLHTTDTPLTTGSDGGGYHPTHSLADAYRFCHQLTRQHSKSFFLSSQLLPAEKRRAVRALYAFCRMSDDTVDLPNRDPARTLADWVRRSRAPHPPADDPVLIAWFDARRRYNLSPALTDELLAGVAMDLSINRYTTFADLWLYCYRVASVVGLLSMGIIGYAPGAEPYAIKLGVALQLTNILRDIGEDVRRGRVYLPQEDLERFGLTADDILASTYDDRFIALMRFQIDRARRFYDESWPGIALLPSDSRLAVAAAARVYRAILDRIVTNNYDVYTHRAYLPLQGKLALLPGIWRDLRRM